MNPLAVSTKRSIVTIEDDISIATLEGSYEETLKELKAVVETRLSAIENCKLRGFRNAILLSLSVSS